MQKPKEILDSWKELDNEESMSEVEAVETWCLITKIIQIWISLKNKGKIHVLESTQDTKQ